MAAKAIPVVFASREVRALLQSPRRIAQNAGLRGVIAGGLWVAALVEVQYEPDVASGSPRVWQCRRRSRAIELDRQNDYAVEPYASLRCGTAKLILRPTRRRFRVSAPSECSKTRRVHSRTRGRARLSRTAEKAMLDRSRMFLTHVAGAARGPVVRRGRRRTTRPALGTIWR